MTLALLFITMIVGVKGEVMTVFSNIGDGKAVVGIEESVTDYVTLANDPKSKCLHHLLFSQRRIHAVENEFL